MKKEWNYKMEKLEMMYEGKAKQVFRTSDDDKVIVHYKDDATAFNGEKKGQIDSKGELNNAITSMLFELLAKKGVKTHFIKKLNERDQLCKKVKIIPIFYDGSMLLLVWRKEVARCNTKNLWGL